MDIDAPTAAALGWPKLKYAFVERERRWLCDAVPDAAVERAETIVDLYVTRTRLRLREATPLAGGEPMRRLARKADVRPGVRLITSLYLEAHEFSLFAGLPGRVVRKPRHHFPVAHGVAFSVDRFEDDLAGLILAEAEFDNDEAMDTFSPPPFCGPEVTNDSRYNGGALAHSGAPSIRHP